MSARSDSARSAPWNQSAAAYSREPAGRMPTKHPRDLTPGTRSILHLALIVGVIAAAVWGVSLFHRLGTDGDASSESASLNGQVQLRRDAQLAVSSFAVNFNNYSVDDIGGYKQRMLPLMTEDFARSFTYAVDGIVTEVKATKMSSSGKVVQTAVSSIDADRATVLVVADVDVTSALGDRERHFRWKVSVVQQDGAWLVDDFEPVA